MRTYAKNFICGTVLIFTAFLFIFCSGTTAFAANEAGYVSYDEAVLQLQNELAERAETVTLYVRSENLLSSSCAYDMYHNEGFAHTGDPKKGDYIRYNQHGCTFSQDYYQGEDGAYYYTLNITPTWFTTAEMEAEVDAAIAAVLDELDLYDANDYEKILGAYNFVCEHVHYDYDTLHDPLYTLKYTTYAALINETAVCQGYASLFYRLMLELDIDCRVITGVADFENHAWNIVRLGDVYYNMDPTWDRSIIVYHRYFLCTEYNFADHSRNSEFSTAAFNAAYPMAELPYVEHVQAAMEANGL